MATKGQQRLLNNLKKAPNRAVKNLTQNLGISAKPLREMTTKEVMELMSKIYFTSGAIEQIESALNGGKDSAGPLSRAEKQVVLQNPIISDLVKKMCIEKAMLGSAVETWNALWDGVKVEGTTVGTKSEDFSELPSLRDKTVTERLSGVKSFKDFMEQFGETLNRSLMHSRRVRGSVDYVMKESDTRPVYAKQRAKNSQTVDKPTISLIERMNGSEEHISQAINFMNYIDGKISLQDVTSGPYTYSELARITMTTASRDCIFQMQELQKSRSEGEKTVSFAENMTDDERKVVEAAKVKSRAKLSEAVKTYEDDCAHGNISTLKSYAERINKLVIAERNARREYSELVITMSNDMSTRETHKGIVKQLDEAEEAIASQDDHISGMTDLLIRSGGIGLSPELIAEANEDLKKTGPSGVVVEEIDASGTKKIEKSKDEGTER